MVPPIKLWDAGVPNEAALRIMTRNSRMPDVARRRPRRRVLGLPDGRRAGSASCSTATAATPSRPASTRSSTRRPRPSGARSCQDPRRHLRLGGLRRARRRRRAAAAHPADHADPDRRRRPGRRAADHRLHRHRPQAKGPINHCGDYADGNFLKKWLAPILRNLADTPERMAELDVNEGVVPLIEMRFPPKGTLLTPIFPAPTNARTFVILRLLGVLAGVVAKAVDGRMPADQETIRYTGVYGEDRDGSAYLMREVLGGGSGGRYYADGEDTIHVVPDSRNLPTEFTEARFPFRRRAARPGRRLRRRRAVPRRPRLREAHPDAHATRTSCPSPTARSSSCWGVKGGKAGRPFQVTIDPGGPNEREVDALADAEPVQAGEVIRIRTTGGGGWGDPLEPPLRRGRARRALGQGVARGRARATTASSPRGTKDEPGRRRRRPPTRCAQRAARRARGRASRSSTAAPATPRWPRARRAADVDWL